MKNVKVTTFEVHPHAGYPVEGEEILINWDRVDFVKNGPDGKYRELHCGEKIIKVQETVEEIDKLLSKDEGD